MAGGFNGKLILASGSPRRKELLEQAGIRFEVMVRAVEETWPPGLKGEQIAVHLAAKKAEAFIPERESGHLIITADTIVCLDEMVLNKPGNRDEAISMLQVLSGKTHRVITGVCLATGDKSECFSTTTNVTFKKLPLDEIIFYVDHYKPFDKAGAYGIQEWIGLTGITSIEGSYFNVVGLPVMELYERIRKLTGITP